jgi:hypothetical protein
MEGKAIKAAFDWAIEPLKIEAWEIFVGAKGCWWGEDSGAGWVGKGDSWAFG